MPLLRIALIVGLVLIIAVAVFAVLGSGESADQPDRAGGAE